MISQFHTVLVRCRASRAGAGSGHDEACNTVLGYVPGPVRFVSLATRAPDGPTTRIWLKCSRRDCKTWNIFEVIAPR